MQPLASAADFDWDSLLAAWPTAAFVLDRDGTVLVHGGGEASLSGWFETDARGTNFFVDIIPGGEVPELGGAFHASMDDDEVPMDLSLGWRLESGDRHLDVRLRLRKVVSEEQTLCIALVEDDTRLQTAESALAAAMGEAREQQHADPVTGLWGRRQFDFVLPVELRRAHRYGIGTTLMAIDARRDGPDGADGPLALTDIALRALGAQLQGLFRLSDVLFRFEESRFHIVLCHTDSVGADGALRRLVAATAHLTVPGVPAGQLVLRMAMSTSGTFEVPTHYVHVAQTMLAQVDAELDAG